MDVKCFYFNLLNFVFYLYICDVFTLKSAYVCADGSHRSGWWNSLEHGSIYCQLMGREREDEHQKGVYLRIVWRRSEIRQIYSVIVLNFATVDVDWGYLYHPFCGSQDATLLGAVRCRTGGELSYSAWTLAVTVPLKGPLLEPRNVERTIVGFTSFFCYQRATKNILKHFAVIHLPSTCVWTRTMCILITGRLCKYGYLTLYF